MGDTARWEPEAATRGQRTAGNLPSRPQPTAKLPCCSRSSVRTSVALTLPEAGASGGRARIPLPLRLLGRNWSGVRETAPQWARRGAGCSARGCGSGGQRRRPRTSDSGEGGLSLGGVRAAPGRLSQPERLPLLLGGSSPHPHPQLRACHFCAAWKGDRYQERSGESSKMMPGCWLCS